MKVIWKYQLEVTDWQSVFMPEDAFMLAVQVQDGVPCIWALVDPKNPQVNHNIRTVGTGQEFRHNEKELYKYIGTYQLHDGALIGHVWEVI